MLNIVHRIAAVFKPGKQRPKKAFHNTVAKHCSQASSSRALNTYNENTKTPSVVHQNASQNNKHHKDEQNHEQSHELPHFTAANVNHDFYQTLLNKPLNLSLTSAKRRKQLNKLLTTLMDNPDLRDNVTPRLPTVLPRILQCLRDDGSSVNDIAELIQQDPNVAANVLRSSNSILYNPGGQAVDSFDRAVVIIGRSGLKSIACTAMMNPISSQKYEGNESFGKQLWAHSLRTAIAAQLLAEPHDINPFTAYLAGLFHNIGEITLFNQINLDGQHSVLEKANSFYYLQQQGLDKLSYEIIKLWQLTDEISDIFCGKASSTMLQILEQAVVLSQAIYLLDMGKMNKTEFYQVTINFNLKKHICDQTIAITDATLNPI